MPQKKQQKQKNGFLSGGTQPSALNTAGRWRLALLGAVWAGLQCGGMGTLAEIGTVSAAQATSTSTSTPSKPTPSKPTKAATPTALLPTKADPYHLKLPTTSKRLHALQQKLQAARQLSSTQKQQLLNLQAALSALSSEQKDALDKLEALGSQISTQQNRAAALALQVTQAQQRLQATSQQVHLTGQQVTQLQGEVRRVMQALYRQHNQQYLALLTQASSFSDLMIHARYANIGGQHNVAIVEQLRARSLSLSTQQERQQQQERSLKALQAQQLQQLSQLQATQRQERAVIAGLERTKAGKQALALETQAQQQLSAQNINQLIGKLIQERNAIEQQRRERIEAERVRRAEELRRIKAAQERARKEAARLAALRRAQAIARAKAAAQAKAAARAKLQAKLHQQAVQARLRAQALARQQSQLQARQQQLEAQQHASALALARPTYTSAPLLFPVAGGQVTQPFSAASPWTVIQGAAGAQARSALGGNVLALSSYASLGWVVLIDHGPLVTAYLGLSDTQVQVGQHVSQGQALGHLGGSPVFGAAHMAFQVNRVSGGSRTPVSPPF